jgi:Kef-type K+ transport system membrane component KefB
MPNGAGNDKKLLNKGKIYGPKRQRGSGNAESGAKSMKNHVLGYVLWMLLCGAGIWWALECGKQLESKQPSPPHDHSSNPAQPLPPAIPDLVLGNAHEPLARLFLQLILIICATRLVGALFVRMGQPTVVGEMFAGMLLGPSLFGWLMPHAASFVFEPRSLASLQLLSQIGICLFMFVVGMNFEVEILRHRVRTALLISQVSIVFPFMLGVIAALYLYQLSGSAHGSFISFALFMGISMSITAFPVLARIVEERGLTKTLLGGTALSCAVVGDISAWILLAFIIAIVKATGISGAVFSLGSAVIFILVMILGIKPGIGRWFASAGARGEGSDQGGMTLVLLFVLASALFTDLIGIHALFGAFLAGVVIPGDGVFRNWIQVRIESFASSFLLPIFFAFTGLRTNVGLLNDFSSLALCAGIIVLATLGKLGGTSLMARWTGMSWLESFRLGALMNTRGLMELIALNLGYELGILSPRIFSMLVIMALTTTLMTGPLLTLSDVYERRRPERGTR